MRVLILGGSGMLGHRLWVVLSRYHDTWATLRCFSSVEQHLAPYKSKACWPVDALDFDDVVHAVATVKPELVINCIGLIKQSEQARDQLLAFELNAAFPHRLAKLCRAFNAWVIHVSTDCVFAGTKGNYTEEDPADPTDLYGRSKYLGELSYDNTLTLRTSLIGREIRGKLGLIEWFLGQKGPVIGYQRAIFNGLTTDEFGEVIVEKVIPSGKLRGIYHLSSNPISKCDLLLLVREAYALSTEILPDTTFVCDRTLDSSRFRNATGYVPPNWDVMIRGMVHGENEPIGT